MVPTEKLILCEYLEQDGASPFAEWFAMLEPVVAARVTLVLVRLGRGNLANTKGVGEGGLEYRLDVGPGYRVYFGRDGEALVILLAGGTKKQQQRDIEVARAWWADYRRRKRSTR